MNYLNPFNNFTIKISNKQIKEHPFLKCLALKRNSKLACLLVEPLLNYRLTKIALK